MTNNVQPRLNSVPNRISRVRPYLLWFEYDIVYVIPPLASFGIGTPLHAMHPPLLVFSLVESGLVRC